MDAQASVGGAVLDEHAADEDAFGHGTLAGAGDLEALAGMGGEAVQVQTVVPVGATDERQLVGAQVGHGVGNAAAQVLHQGRCQGFVVVKGDLLFQNGEVAGFPQVGIGTGYQPQGIIVKAGANSQVALFGQGLILMVGRAIGELGGGNVQQPLSCLFGNHVDKAQ